MPEFFPSIAGFQRDEGNANKIRQKHGVTPAEAEQVFFNRPFLVAESAKAPGVEVRHFALGRTDADRLLAAVFTFRGGLLRMISARLMSRRERRSYAQAQATEANPQVQIGG